MPALGENKYFSYSYIVNLFYTASVWRMTEGPLRKLVNALMAMLSSSVNRVLISLNFAEAVEAMEFTDELLFSLMTSSCSLSDESVGDVVRLKLKTV